MAHKPYKNRRKEESFHGKRRLNPSTRAASILIILAVIISSSCSGGAETKSSQAEITELTVGINSTDYSITFDENNAETVTIPYVSTLPTELMVKTAAISAKATGLAAGDTLKITSGKAEITVAAEDGSTTVYTLSIEVEAGTPLTSLTYSTSTIDAAEGNPITAITPTIVPKDATAEYAVNPQLPAGLELNPKSGAISGTPTDAYAAEAVYTVTARGTEGYTGSATAAITIAVGVSRNIVVTETAKTNPEKDQRYHYVVFIVKADGTTSMGRHKFALKLKTETAPTVQEMNDGAGVYRIVDSTAKKILLSYSLSSGIRALAANTNYLDNIVKNGDTVDGGVVDIDSYLLTPGETYTLYALKDEDSSVTAIKDFNTDTFNPNNTPLTDRYVNDPAMSGDYFYDASDVIFVLPISLFIAGTISYNLEEPNEPPFLVYPITFGVPDPLTVGNGIAVLIPSHFTEGGKDYRTIDGKKVAGLFAILPSTLFPDEGSFSVHVAAGSNSHISITFHPDR